MVFLLIAWYSNPGDMSVPQTIRLLPDEEKTRSYGLTLSNHDILVPNVT